MEGRFHKNASKLSNILGLIAGASLSLLFGFILCVSPYDALGDLILAIFFICLGAVVALLCGVSLYVNRRAFIRVDERTMDAFCHFGLRLRCDITDIDEVVYAGMGLNIRLKNGKRYCLMSLENAYEIGRYITRLLPPPKTQVCLSEEALRTELARSRHRRKQLVLMLIVAFVLWFGGIGLTVALTDGKEMRDFDGADWRVFAVMTGVCLVIVSGIVWLTCKTARLTETCEKLRNRLACAVLLTAPVQSGNVLGVYMDDAITPSMRLTVYGYPNAPEVYYVEEHIDREARLVSTNTSEVFRDLSEIGELLACLQQIPEETLKNNDIF